MIRAAGTALTGLGVTLASTFASSLGLSVHQQRIGFAVGIALMAVGAIFFIRGTSREAAKKPTTPSREAPQAVHVLPASHGMAGRLAAERGMTPLERWLRARIEEAERHKRERVVLGSSTYRQRMSEWDFQNVNELLEDHASLVKSYRGDPPGHLPGAEHEEAYYDRQLAWLHETLHKLRNPIAKAAVQEEPGPIRRERGHIEIGEGRSRVVVHPLSFDPQRQRSDPHPLQRGYSEMDALLRRQWNEAKGERRARETIPPEHRQELRGFLTGAITALEGEQQYHYDEVPAITQTNRAVFAAHFPKPAERLDAWNRALFDRDAPVGPLSDRIVREAHARGFNEPGEYWQNEVARLVKDVTSTRLRKDIPAPQVGSLVEWEQRVDGFGPTLHANGYRIATAQHDSGDVLQRKREAVESWLAEIQSWPEVDAYSEAKRRFALYTDRHDLLAELHKLVKIEHLPNASECEVCRGNRGDFD